MDGENVILEGDYALDSQSIEAVVNILTGENYSLDTRLKVLNGFKLIFSKGTPTLESKIFSYFDVEFLFDVIASANKENTASDDILQDYGLFLLQLLNYKPNFIEKIRTELKWFMKHSRLFDSWVRRLWLTMEKNEIIWPDVIQEILPYSKLFFEEKVFEWVTIVTNCSAELKELNINYYAQLSVECSEIFKIINLILNQFIVLTNGNEEILKWIRHFALSVTEYCDQTGNNIFKLYPKQYCHLLPLLSVPPEVFHPKISKKNQYVPGKTDLLELLLRNFTEDRNIILLFLTHYPKWVGELVNFLKERNKNHSV